MAEGAADGPEVAVAVVGAGLTGLALTHELAARGVTCLTLEAGPRPGGVIRSRWVGGRLLELGPQRARLVPELDEMVRALGLGDELIRAQRHLPLFVYRGGRLRQVPFSAGQFVATDLLSFGGKLRLLLEPLVALCESVGEIVRRRPDRRPGSRRGRPGESVADFLVRRLGREAYRHLVGPLYGGIYGTDPADMPLDRTLGPALDRMGVGPSLLVSFLRRGGFQGGGASLPPAVSFRDGLSRLPEALARRHGDRIRFERPVSGLDRTADGSGWLVRSGDRAVCRARHVVLTVPANEAGRILSGPAPEAASRLVKLTYNRLVVAGLRSRARLSGYGYQVSPGEPLHTRGVTWNHGLFSHADPGRRGVYTAYLGGAGREELLEAPDRELGEIAAREFGEVTGEEARSPIVHRTRMPAWDRSWEALDGLELPGGIRLCAAYTDRAGIPGRLAAARAAAEELAAGEGSARTAAGT